MKALEVLDYKRPSDSTKYNKKRKHNLNPALILQSYIKI